MRDLFFAKEADPSCDLFEILTDEHDKHLYRLTEKRASRPLRLQLDEHEILLLKSPWKGDPDLWRAWNGTHAMLMRLFRQRCSQGSDGEVGGIPEDFSIEYAFLGITWVRKEDGDLNVTQTLKH